MFSLNRPAQFSLTTNDIKRDVYIHAFNGGASVSLRCGVYRGQANKQADGGVCLIEGAAF